MNKQAIQKLSFCTLFVALFAMQLLAQPIVVRQCGIQTPIYSTSYTPNTILPTSAVFDFSAYAGYVVSDVKVSVTWSKGSGGCGSIDLNTPTDLSEIGFRLATNTGITQILGLSAYEALDFSTGTTSYTSMFSGTMPVSSITTNFVSHGGISQAPSGSPVPNGNYHTNSNGTNNFSGIIGQNAVNLTGNWNLIVRDDDPATTGSLCVESFCVEVSLCTSTSFAARCSTNASIVIAPDGIAVPTFETISALSDTACGLRSISFTSGTVTNPSFTCADIGTAVPITMTLTSNLGATSTCTTTATVRDLTPPVINCAPRTIYLDTLGRDTIKIASILATDNCTASTSLERFIRLPNNTLTTFRGYNCNHLAGSDVTLVVRDASGNEASCLVPVTVLDTVAPRAKCKPVTLYLSTDGTATLNAVDINNLSTDNCGISSILVNNAASVYYTCANVGTTTATLTVRDNSNNVSSCSETITILDTIRPVARCQDITVNLDAAGLAMVTPAQINNGSTDNCTAANNLTLLINNTASLNLNCSNITNTTTAPVAATLTVRDANNNSNTCIANITVVDNIAPTALCKPVTVTVDNNGLATVTPTMLNNGSLDNCTPSSNLVFSLTTASLPSLNVSCLGNAPSSIILNVTDASGNTASCTSTLTLQDTIAPVANCISSIDIFLDNTGTANLTALEIDNASTDNCGIAVKYINNGSIAQYGCADIGTPQTAVLYVEDNAGNFDECNTIVNVLDNIPPVARCQDINAYVNNAGTVRIYAEDIDNALQPSSDNCGSVSLTINGAPYVEYTNCPIGVTPVILTATDDQGLSNSCSAQISILDTIRPTAVCRPYTAVLPSGGQAVVNASQIRDAQSRDNCSITTSLIDGNNSKNFSCANVGPNTVTLTLTDASGNASTCTTTVTVVDNLAPTARCRTSYTAVLNAAGEAVVEPSNINNNSIDNCGIVEYRINNTTSVTYTCNDVNPATPIRATLTLRDAAGNTSSCMSDIIVEDRIIPVAICQSSMTIDLPSTTSNTTVTVPAIDFNNGSTDNCSNLRYSINGQSNITFDCGDIGPNNYVTLTVTDNSNNSNTCITRVEVRDLVAPIADCNATLIALVDNTGLATISSAQVNRNSIDNCGNITLTLSDSIFQCIPNTQTVTLTVTDDSGNNSTCTSVISVVDNIAPTVTTCNATLTVDLDNAGTASLNATAIATATDNCGTPTYTINNNPSIDFTCTDAGRTIPVTVSITDASGNMATCASNITVRDITPPTAICQNPTIYLNGDGLATLTAAQVDNNSSDICGIQSLSINNTNFTCTNLTTNNTVILTVTDVNGLTNVCTASVTVLDTISPVAICNNPTVYLDNTGVANVTAAMINNNSTDNCGIAFSSINNQQNIGYTCANIGANNTITLLVRDGSGNTNTCTSTVTVLDNIAPVITCNTIPVSLSAVGAATVNAAQLATATDICGATLTLANGGTSIDFDCTNVGANTIAVIATDPSGNTSTCNATVNIVDDTRPTAICRLNTVFLNPTGITTIDPMLIDNGSNDACGIASMVISPATVDCQQLAIDPNPTVTLTVTDVNGNISACSVQITLVDSTAPTAICAPFNAYLSATGTVDILPSNIDNGSNDACGIDPLSFRINGASQVTYTCADAGPQTVTLSVSDIYNNTATCQTTVTVLDTVAPVANCFAEVVAYLNATGQAEITGAMLDNLSTDLCGINTSAFLINGAPSVIYQCNQVNTTQNALLTVFDVNGNSSTCSSIIRIQDTIAPVANCVTTPIDLNLNAISGQVSLNATALNNGSTDNCNGIASYLINGVTRTTFNCNDVGSNFITLTVTDNNGNSSTCQSEVIVHDITAPVAHCQQNLQLYLPNATNATVAINAIDLDNGSTDNCGIVSYLINGQNTLTFDCANINIPTAVVFTISDLEGNTSVCNSVITVRDTVRPVALCATGIISAPLDNSGIVTVTPGMINIGSYDNCGITDILVNNTRQIVYTCTDLGTHNVTLTVRDANGLESSCTAEILVEDNIAPTAYCYNSITVDLDANGVATVLAEALDSASIDACLPLTRLINNAPSISFDCQQVGINPTTLTIYDASNNMASCVTNIIVRDVTAPTAICNTVNAVLDANGEVRVTAQAVAGNSIDNCNVNTYTFATGREVIYSCDDLGTHTLTVTVSDLHGNSAQCTADITVVDTTAPTITCRPTATINLTNTTIGYLNSNLLVVNGSITDNCNIDALSFSRDFVTCADGNSIVPITVTVTDQSGNTNSCISEVTVNLQMPVITSINEVCAGETLPLQATIPSGATNYTVSWSGPNGFTATTANASIPNVDESNEGQYIVTITPTTTGCPASDTIDVIVHTVNEPIITALSPTCENDDAIFSITNLADYAQANTLTFEWFKGGISLGQTDSVLVITNATATDAGSYTVIITMNGCAKTSAAFELEIMPLPAAPLLSSNIPCEMQELELEAVTDGLRTYTFAWSGPDAFTSTTENPIIANASQANAGLYSLVITDQYGCTATNDISVTVAPKPQAPSLVYNSPLCADDLLEITDTNTYIITPMAYNWILADASTASTTIPQLVVTAPVVGTYSLVVNMDGCFSDTSSIAVDYQPNVVAINDDIELEFRDSILNFNVAANDVTNTAYSVSIIGMPAKGNVSINADGTLNYIAGYSAFGRDTITYTICDVNCPDNCDTAQVFITIVADFECYIPDAITPNTDGINDVWNISCINEYPNREVSVFSRWGELVYKGNGNDFDGKYKGNDLPDGTYFYILKLNDTTHVPNDTFKGTLIIRR